jgi:hypothetical protein
LGLQPLCTLNALREVGCRGFGSWAGYVAVVQILDLEKGKGQVKTFLCCRRRMPSLDHTKKGRRERQLYSLRKVAEETGIGFEALKGQLKGRRYQESYLSGVDIAVSEVQLRLMPALASFWANENFPSACTWDEVVNEREVQVFQKPPNIRFLLCVDERAQRYHVWVGNSRPFVKGMKLYISPHPSLSLKGFWHIIGPVPRYPGDKSFLVRWREWKKHKLSK